MPNQPAYKPPNQSKSAGGATGAGQFYANTLSSAPTYGAFGAAGGPAMPWSTPSAGGGGTPWWQTYASRQAPTWQFQPQQMPDMAPPPGGGGVGAGVGAVFPGAPPQQGGGEFGQVQSGLTGAAGGGGAPPMQVGNADGYTDAPSGMLVFDSKPTGQNEWMGQGPPVVWVENGGMVEMGPLGPAGDKRSHFWDPVNRKWLTGTQAQKRIDEYNARMGGAGEFMDYQGGDFTPFDNNYQDTADFYQQQVAQAEWDDWQNEQLSAAARENAAMQREMMKAYAGSGLTGRQASALGGLNADYLGSQMDIQRAALDREAGARGLASDWLTAADNATAANRQKVDDWLKLELTGEHSFGTGQEHGGKISDEYKKWIQGLASELMASGMDGTQAQNVLDSARAYWQAMYGPTWV